MTWLVRTTSDPLSLLPAVKEKIREVNPTQTFASIATLDQLLDLTFTVVSSLLLSVAFVAC